ncbi:MAG: hypothetical protein IPO92_11740 [Saprospiraceae bacterium]|nr:hypothetical protein [Saprospiraceae bacterium]
MLPWTYTKDSLHQIDTYQNNLRNTLDRRSGIQCFNGENFAQDLRIAIRGFGSRSAFGIRGIRLFIDGSHLHHRTAPVNWTKLVF